LRRLHGPFRQARQFIGTFASAFSVWARLDNISKVAELGLRLAGIVAALAAAHFFLFRPQLVVQPATVSLSIDVGKFKRAYEEHRSPMPQQIQRILPSLASNTLMFGSEGIERAPPLRGKGLIASSGGEGLLTVNSEWCDSVFSTRPHPALSKYSLSKCALRIRLGLEGLNVSGADLEHAALRMSEHAQTKLSIYVLNNGSATAEEVTVDGPADFHLVNPTRPVRIPPRGYREFSFDVFQGIGGLFPTSDFAAGYKNVADPTTGLLAERAAILALVVVVIVILREVTVTRRDISRDKDRRGYL
jgi:hypothetical protein